MGLGRLSSTPRSRTGDQRQFVANGEEVVVAVEKIGVATIQRRQDGQRMILEHLAAASAINLGELARTPVRVNADVRATMLPAPSQQSGT